MNSMGGGDLSLLDLETWRRQMPKRRQRQSTFRTILWDSLLGYLQELVGNLVDDKESVKMIEFEFF